MRDPSAIVRCLGDCLSVAAKNKPDRYETTSPPTTAQSERSRRAVVARADFARSDPSTPSMRRGCDRSGPLRAAARSTRKGTIRSAREGRRAGLESSQDELLGSVEHRQSKYLNNRAENSHQPTRQCECAMKRFTSPGHAQRFLFAFHSISPHFRPRRHLLTAAEWRIEMADRFAVWQEITATDAVA